MNTKKVAGVAGLIMASTVFIGVTAVHAQDRAVEYKMDIASIERFNQTSREVGLPEMDVPSYEEWLKAKRENEAASSRPTSTSQQPSKQDLMRRWLNKGIRTADDRSSTVAEVEIMRRERLWIKSAQLLVDHRKEMEVAREWARQNGVAESAKLPDGSVMGLVGIRNGIPKYNVTFNAQAADTISVDELWPGGSTGLGLSGTNLLLGIWDGGDVQTNHYAFTSGGAARAIDQDGVSTLPIDPHPTAVAGVMAASGLGYTNARGMAYSTTMWTYDWDDDLESEMVSAYANDLHVSNHSYGRKAGWGYVNIGYVTNCWWGDIAISPNECHIFGLYYDDATNADAVAYGNPHSLTVWASGNDRDDAAPPAGTWYVTFSGTNAIWHSGARPNDYYENGYDTIPGVGVAKNLLCVGATYKIVGGYSGVSSVILAPFSNCGPTDDGRIKPDVVAAGVDHFTPFWHPSDPNTTTYYFTSSGDTNNPSWATGTSFSSPGVAGAVGLLVEQREQHEPSFPYLSSTLKAIVIHTADEAGTTGPDYRTGWGLVNAASAAQLAQADHDAGGKQYIAEVTVADGDYVERTVTATGGVPLKVTIAWTDPTGPAQPEQLDPTNLVLVNDFDLRVIGPGGVTNYPFILNPANPANTATTGDNFRDNVEQVVITNPTANADYVVRVTHKGNLVDDTGSNSVQALSMTFSGILEDSRPQTRVNEFLVDGTSELLGWPSVVGQNYQVQTCTNLLVQDWTNISPEISSTKTNTTWDSGTGPSGILRFYRLQETN